MGMGRKNTVLFLETIGKHYLIKNKNKIIKIASYSFRLNFQFSHTRALNRIENGRNCKKKVSIRFNLFRK